MCLCVLLRTFQPRRIIPAAAFGSTAVLDLYEESEHERQDDDDRQDQEDDLRHRGALDLLVSGLVLGHRACLSRMDDLNIQQNGSRG